MAFKLVLIIYSFYFLVYVIRDNWVYSNASSSTKKCDYKAASQFSIINTFLRLYISHHPSGISDYLLNSSMASLCEKEICIVTGPQNENLSRNSDIAYSQKWESCNPSGVSDVYRQSPYTEVAGGPGCLLSGHTLKQNTLELFHLT